MKLNDETEGNASLYLYGSLVKKEVYATIRGLSLVYFKNLEACLFKILLVKLTSAKVFYSIYSLQNVYSSMFLGP